MTILVKDHKTWDLIPKTRPVMGGNEGGNQGISEFLSLVLEPVAREQEGHMEINATNGLLADIKDLNDELELEDLKTSSPEEYISTQEEEFSTLLEEGISSHQEDEMRLPTPEENVTSDSCQRAAQMDIRVFLEDGKEPCMNPTKPEVKDEPVDKMQMIRNR